jgi:hypothetical protein
MHMRRLIAAANERSVAYDVLLSEHSVQRLFDCAALWFARPDGGEKPVENPTRSS